MFNVFLIILAVFLPSVSLAGVVDGIVLSNDGPVLDATVLAYPDYQSLLNHQGAVTAVSTKKPGEFHMELPAGGYYFIARNSDHSKPLYAYHGRNPIVVSDGKQWLPLFALPDEDAQCKDGFQGIGGQALYNDTPLTSGSVSVYDVNDEPFRGMGILTNTIGEDGNFWFDLAPGRYMIFARQRQEASAMGPLKDHDLFCYSAASPINIRAAHYCQVNLFCYPRNNLQVFLNKNAIDPRGSHESGRRLASLEGNKAIAGTDSTSLNKNFAIIAGRVTDIQESPISQLVVSAYPADDLNLFAMYIVRFKSKFMARTNEKGFFRLELPAGSYYLVARQMMAEAPASGEYYGLYEGNSNHSIQVNPGESHTGIQILVSRVMP
jgi:hypothetical protein